MDSTCIGNAVVTRVVEWHGELATAEQLFPETPAAAWREHVDQLAPAFWNPDSDRCRLAIQTWVVEVDGLTVLVDTGVGNDRNRPQSPVFHRLKTPFLEALVGAGVEPGDVDVVVNTHIHLDHVGWNTMLRYGAWQPTFPNARYVVPAADYWYFHPDNASNVQAPRTDDEQARLAGMRLVFEDSISPVDDAGQVVTWSDDYQLSRSLRLRAAPGHTPGSSVLWLDGPPNAVFVGDITHTPLQIRRPDDPCAFDIDFASAALSRRRVLAEAASSNAVVIPAHYPGHGGASLHPHDGAFQVDRWLGLTSI
jgi:glyoxylase-like metal-dependent hydrolase (beta-lactamase superfamily II)